MNNTTYLLAREGGEAGSWRLVHRLRGIPNPSSKPGQGKPVAVWLQGSAWSPNSRFLARVHRDYGDLADPMRRLPGFVSLVEGTSGTWRVVGTFPHEKGSVDDVAWSPDGQRFASIGGDDTCRIWRVPTENKLRRSTNRLNRRG